MTLQVRFITQRPTTDAEFWWNSTDNEIKHYCDSIKLYATNLGIDHSFTVAEDGLSSVSAFTVSSVKQWNDLNTQIVTNLPNMFGKRQSYYTASNHTLKVEWLDSNTQSVVLKNDRVLEADGTLY